LPPMDIHETCASTLLSRDGYAMHSIGALDAFYSMYLVCIAGREEERGISANRKRTIYHWARL
jgi:hypothetical protein